MRLYNIMYLLAMLFFMIGAGGLDSKDVAIPVIFMAAGIVIGIIGAYEEGVLPRKRGGHGR